MFEASCQPQHALAGERVVLDRVNDVVRKVGAPPLSFLGQIYAEIDERFLTTFAEIDHFGPRETAHYWGAWPEGLGQSANVDWPRGDGPRVYGYLKPFKAIEALLERLSMLRLPTLIVGDGMEPAMQERFASETLRFVRHPIDAAIAGQWCDLAILNATHGMLCAMLLAGKPTLNIPLHFEQRLAAMKVVQLRAGVAASAQQPEEALRALEFVLENSDPLAVAARRFAEKHRNFDSAGQINKLLGRLEELLR